MLSLTLVWEGFFRNYPPYHEPPSRYGAAVEWRSQHRDGASSRTQERPGSVDR